jgi:hypothetical protein
MKILNAPSLVAVTALFVIAASAYAQHPSDGLVSDSRQNTMMGGDALPSLDPIRTPGVNPVGYDYSAAGWQAPTFTAIGHWSIANGWEVPAYNKIGHFSTAAHRGALLTTSTGSYNTAEGLQGGINLARGGYDIDVRNPGLSRENRGLRIGPQAPAVPQANSNIAVTYANPRVSDLPIAIDSNGQLGVTLSLLGALQNLR